MNIKSTLNNKHWPSNPQLYRKTDTELANLAYTILFDISEHH